MIQAPDSIFMVRPEHFGYNPETAESNAFQADDKPADVLETKQLAIAQFDGFVDKLRSVGINVLVFHSPEHLKLPDAVFPNNWVTFHEDGSVWLYPMLAKNRRLERRMDLIDEIGKQFLIKEVIDLSPAELNNQILEGSGSIVFDHINLVAYANASARTNRLLFDQVCRTLGYQGVYFYATDEKGVDIFHTNVMMMIGEGYCVICLSSIPMSQRNLVLESLRRTGLEIVEITLEQMSMFAGNMIQLQDNEGKKFLVMSETAYNSLDDQQLKTLTSYNDILYADVSIIEEIGGGSARCMIAGIHLPKKI